MYRNNPIISVLLLFVYFDANSLFAYALFGLFLNKLNAWIVVVVFVSVFSFVCCLFCWLFSLLIFPYFSADTLLSSYFNGMIWSLSCLRVCTSYYDFNEMHDNMLHSKHMWTHLLFFFLFPNTMIVRIINKITSLNLNWMIHNKMCLFRSSYIHSMKAHTIL